MTAAEDLVKTYRQAERRLHEMLFGDGVYTAGLVKGEEARLQVRSALRRMREALDTALADSETDRVESAELRVADLEEELQRLVSQRRQDRAESVPETLEKE